MRLLDSIKAWLSPPLPEDVGTPIQRLCNAFLLTSMNDQHGFVLCANEAQMFMSFFRDGVFTESLDLSAKLALATQARLVEMIGFDEHRPQEERLFIDLGDGRVEPFVAWIRTSATGDRLTIAHYKNDAGERVLEQRLFFEELARGRRAYVAKDFDGALRSTAIALTLTDSDRYLTSCALGAKLSALIALGAAPLSEEAFVLQSIEAALGARHPVTLHVKAELAGERLKFGQREEALHLWRSVREPFCVIFGEDDPIGAELDALL
jgi:hypothetical protein